MKLRWLLLLLMASGSLVAQAGELPRELSLDLGGGVALKMVLIPPGKYMRGSNETGFDAWSWGKESPRHEVTISKPFYMAVHPLTVEQFDTITGKKSPFFESARNRPKGTLSWVKAVEFCKAISEKTGRTLQLPTEAQWEYACRAGTATRWYFGDDPGVLTEYAYTRKTFFDAKGKPVANRMRDVCKLKPNAWGLYDMNGLIHTWCQDWYGEYDSAPATDPKGPSEGKRRVARGGSYFDPPERCTSASRWPFVPDDCRATAGLRVVAAAE